MRSRHHFSQGNDKEKMRTNKRVRITRRDIEKARQELAQAPKGSPPKPKAEKEKARWRKDFWHGLVYCDSYGHAWTDNFEPVYLGQTEEIIPYLKSRGIDGENYNMVIEAAEEFRAEKKFPSCHPATKGDATPVKTSGASPNRATFKDNPRFLRLLDGLIAKGCGTPTIQKELREKGYDVPYRTLGRWVNGRKISQGTH